MTDLRCQREDCGRVFEDDETAESVRCSFCGEKQAPTPASTSSDESDEETVAIDGAAGVTITVTIEVEPSG